MKGTIMLTDEEVAAIRDKIYLTLDRRYGVSDWQAITALATHVEGVDAVDASAEFWTALESEERQSDVERIKGHEIGQYRSAATSWWQAVAGEKKRAARECEERDRKRKEKAENDRWRADMAARGKDPDVAAVWTGLDYDEDDGYARPYSGGSTGEVLADDDDGGWSPVDLTEILSGTYEPIVTELFRRTDGIALFYRGLVHSMYGDSESGKSWVAQAACADVLREGGSVLYLDFEDSAPNVVGRMRMLGAETEALTGRFVYANPQTRHTLSTRRRDAFATLLGRPYDLVVLDGVTEALTTYGLDGRLEKDVSEFNRVVKEICAETGAAVVTIDHVVKSKDARGNSPIGSQHKRSILTGASYVVAAATRIAPGCSGVVTVRVAKDRPGHVRANSGERRESDATQETARVTLDSTRSGRTVITVNSFERGVPVDTETGEKRYTAIMEKVSRLVESAAEPLTQRRIIDTVKGNRAATISAVGTLVEEGYLAPDDPAATYLKYASARPYRLSEDALSGDDVILSGTEWIRSEETGDTTDLLGTADGLFI